MSPRQNQSGWQSPLLLALTTGLVAILTNYLSACENRNAEARSLERQLVLEAIRVGNPDDAKKNLELLAGAGLLPTHEERMKEYLTRPESKGFYLPSPGGSGIDKPIRFLDDVSKEEAAADVSSAMSESGYLRHTVVPQPDGTFDVLNIMLTTDLTSDSNTVSVSCIAKQ